MALWFMEGFMEQLGAILLLRTPLDPFAVIASGGAADARQSIFVSCRYGLPRSLTVARNDGLAQFSHSLTPLDSHASLRRTYLVEANLERANLTNAKLEGAFLEETNLDGVIGYE
jgi:hypothetical protein